MAFEQEKKADLLAQNRPQANYPTAIVSREEIAVKTNALKDAVATAHLTPKQVVEVVRSLFPSFDKSMLSKCMKPEKYGVVIHPLGLAAITGDTPQMVPDNPMKGETGMTQCERILRHFKDYGSITSREAMNEYGIMRLASRISDLRKLGYDITVTTETSKNRYGEPTSYARYSMEVSSDE